MLSQRCATCPAPACDVFIVEVPWMSPCISSLRKEHNGELTFTERLYIAISAGRPCLVQHSVSILIVTARSPSTGTVMPALFHGNRQELVIIERKLNQIFLQVEAILLVLSVQVIRNDFAPALRGEQ